MRKAVITLSLALGAAAPPAAAMVPPIGPGRITAITYETGPCFGACPIYRVTVTERGVGIFEGRRFTAVTGVRNFAVSRRQFSVFAAHLAPVRPANRRSVRYEGPALCPRMATDMPTATVSWRSTSGGAQTLTYYYGCDPEKNRTLAERLRTAPALLPIAAMIGPRPGR
jgi:hypothetical protein